MNQPPERFKAFVDRARTLLETGDHGANDWSGPQRPDPSLLRNDAFHWPEYRDHSHPFWFVEWWYFAFSDEEQGLSGIVALGVFNPGNIDGLGAASAFTAILDSKTGEITTKMDLFDLKQFAASYRKADVTLGQNTNRALDEDTYELAVESKDGELALNLTYRRTEGIGPHWMGYQEPGTTREWEVSSWIAWMPSARTEGTLRLGDRKIELSGSGYHDHNWAVWLFPASTWTWAMFEDPDQTLAFDFAAQASFGFQQAYFRFGDIELDFADAELEPGNWTRWMGVLKYPTTANFSATARQGDEEYRLVLQWETELVAPLWKAPMVIFEQEAKFTGTLFQRDPVSGWKPIHEFEQKGFYEYTAKWV